MKSLIIFLSCCFLFTLTQAQQYIKNAGIKTSLSARNQLQEANKTQNTQEYYVDKYGNNLEQREMTGYNRYGPDFKPAQVYVPEESQNYIIRSTPAPILDPIAKFINETRSKMASGVCFKSVRTSTLVTNSNMNNVIGNERSVPDTSKMGCQPVCIPDCGYGRCVAPNQCECFLGYQKRMNGTSCEANCYLRCENGICVNHTTCACQDGYKFDNHTTSCLPDCGEDCENGICVSPGVCRCFKGYVLKNHKCEGICKSGCGDYGKCIGPNICGCSVIDGPMRLFQRCEHGFCTSEGRCQCEVGKTRFLNKCLSPDKVTTYVSMNNKRYLNITFIEEFNFLIGNYFQFGVKMPQYYLDPMDSYYTRY